MRRNNSRRSFVYQGGKPVNISYTNIPNDHQSTAVPCPFGSRETISGAKYSGVPQNENVRMLETSFFLEEEEGVAAVEGLMGVGLEEGRVLVGVVAGVVAGVVVVGVVVVGVVLVDVVLVSSRALLSCVTNSWSNILDNPKSASLTCPSPSNKTFSGFKSRYTTPRECN